jgi:hypothetical protein
LETGGGGRNGKGARNNTHLHFGPQNEVRITRIGKTKYSAKLFHGEVANITNFELRRLSHDRTRYGGEKGGVDEHVEQRRGCSHTHLSAHLQFYDLNLVCDDWRFGALVEGCVEHFDSVGMELVGEAGPLERKGHCGSDKSELCDGHRQKGRISSYSVGSERKPAMIVRLSDSHRRQERPSLRSVPTVTVQCA